MSPAGSNHGGPRAAIVETSTSFVGREGEIAALRDRFDRGAQIVTILGPGGIGKTRLALCFAATLAAEREVVIVDLTESTTLRDLCAALAGALGASLASAIAEADALTHLGRLLGARGEVLLVLDNVEQLAAEAAPAVARLVESTAGLRVLVTSRERLRVRGEALIELAPLSFPSKNEADPALFPAVQLFHERARAVAPGWGDAPGDAAILAAIVRRLEGFPLAIELCATRSRVLDPAALLARLQQSFDVLAAGARDAGDRHLTLARTLEWSLQMLSPVERSALAQCSIFAGGFTLDAAESVLDLGPAAPPVIDVLESLVDRSLLRSGALEPGRFSFYSVIREHAARALAMSGDVAAVESRHRDWYLDLGERLVGDAEVRGSEARRRLALERENLAAVHARAVASTGDPHRAEAALRAGLLLDEILALQGPFREHFALIDAAICAAEPASVDRALLGRALDARGRAHHAAGRGALALVDLEESLAIALAIGDPAAEARARSSLCVALRVARRFDEASNQGHLALALHEMGGLPRFEIFTLGALAAIDFDAGRIEAAAILFERAERLAHRIGDRWSEAMATAFQGHVRQERGDLAGARRAFERAVALFRAVFDERHAAIFAGYLAGVRHEQGEHEAAREGYSGAAASLAELGGARYEGLFRACLGSAAAALGRVDEARAAFEMAAILLEKVADPALLLALAIHRLHLDLGAPGGASRALAECAALVEDSPLVAASDDLRFALRVLHRAIAAAPRSAAPGTPSLRIDRDARWFELSNGARTSLARKRSLRLLLHALVDARLRSPGRALDGDALLAIGWPGERVLRAAGAHRVQVAIATLRQLGLRAHLTSRDDGYLLDPSLPVELVADEN
jgi:predicted ATPase